jgi:16S rRNA (adenine1518-N6/adenine1519-N6)-dimethyltransferase
MKLSEMKQILSGRDIRLTKSLGQNFLHDGNQLRRIAAAADLNPADKVLEVGPGLGPLTELLMEQAGEVLAIEMDARLVRWLEERFAGSMGGKLRLVRDDALEYLRRERADWHDWKLVSNLPYSVASPILVELAQNPRGPKRMVATLQLEVARRLMAGAGDADYGILTLLVQLNYEPRGSLKIPAGCFFPAPDVDSACVCLERRGTPLLESDQFPAFAAIVKRSFSQRRKMMLKLLRPDWPEGIVENAFLQLGLPLQARAETVSLAQYADLTRVLTRAK